MLNSRSDDLFVLLYLFNFPGLSLLALVFCFLLELFGAIEKSVCGQPEFKVDGCVGNSHAPIVGVSCMQSSCGSER